VEFAVTVGLVGGLGFLADSHLELLDVFPVFLLLGVLLGTGLGIYRLDYQLKAFGQKSNLETGDQASNDQGNQP
jgi:F0F1-type ATP synthase assembly protein I